MSKNTTTANVNVINAEVINNGESIRFFIPKNHHLPLNGKGSMKMVCGTGRHPLPTDLEIDGCRIYINVAVGALVYKTEAFEKTDDSIRVAVLKDHVVISINVPEKLKNSGTRRYLVNTGKFVKTPVMVEGHPVLALVEVFAYKPGHEPAVSVEATPELESPETVETAEVTDEVAEAAKALQRAHAALEAAKAKVKAQAEAKARAEQEARIKAEAEATRQAIVAKARAKAEAAAAAKAKAAVKPAASGNVTSAQACNILAQLLAEVQRRDAEAMGDAMEAIKAGDIGFAQEILESVLCG